MMDLVRRTCLAFLLLPTNLWAGDWPQFRGPGGTAVSEETGLPVRWSPTDNIRWKVDLPGRGVSSPVIAAGKVYVTACTGFQQTRLHVLCYDAVNGKKLWERQFWATGNTMCNDKTCMAAPTPVTDGDHVYALFACGDLVCLDAAGNLQWYRALARDYPTLGNNVGMAASPVLWKDILILPLENPGDSFVAGLDKHSGQNLWRTDRDRDLNWVTPLVIDLGDQPQVLLQSQRELTACDPRTGQKLWSYKSQALSNVPSPFLAKGMVFVAGGGLIALQPGTESVSPTMLWQANKLASGYTTPLFYEDRVYAVHPAGLLNCCDAAKGKVLWQQRLRGSGNQYWASPVAADGKIYVVDEGGTTTVIRPGVEPKILATNALEGIILATPAIAVGAIFLRSDRHLFCISDKKVR
jgi:outer membrane protein assembly factor BamB